MKQILIEKYIEPSSKENIAWFFVETWNDKYGDKHSVLGRPSAIHYENGKMVRQFWYKKGELHRDRDLPARIDYNSNGQIRHQYWYKKGVTHRDGALPAYISYNSNGQIIRQSWYKNGKFIKGSL